MLRFFCVRLTILLFIGILFLFSCTTADEKPFLKLSASQTQIDFTNHVENTPEFNILSYLYFYDGGGVAAGDLNNDGLPDLFFTANEEPNRLYLNRGDYKFEEITEQAGIINDDNSWSTGVTMADVNGDGYLDIYVSRVNYLTKSGKNQLFINNGDETFTEAAAEYGIDFEGYSTQAVFFDYNNSGRLDLFILNHSFHSDKTYGEADELRQIFDPKAGDRLFRNDGNIFTDVTREAGIYSSALGYGLGVAVSDLNQDGFPDIYVGNDFHEDDYLYINNGDGTFTEALYDVLGHTSSSSMGNDIADISNNGQPDIISLDMMPGKHEVFLKSGGPDLLMLANAKKDFGFGDKNARNTLQVNRGKQADGLPLFSEIAFASGVDRTDWSWAALFADFDNSGFADLFITNGMPHRPNDLDFVRRLQNIRSQPESDDRKQKEFELIDGMPPIFVPNYMFKNNGDYTFDDVSDAWGFSELTFSSGAVYADLNNNGKLDLVVNNTNGMASVYQNMIPNSEDANFLKVKLNGQTFNRTGIGSKIMVYSGDKKFYREQFPTRGFQSSVDHVVHIGLGEVDRIDSLWVIWPDHSFEAILAPEINQRIVIDYSETENKFNYELLSETKEPLLIDISDSVQLDFEHRENRFNDFQREPLIPYKQSRQGPALAVADVTGNGLDDLFFGGAHGQSAKLFLQQANGTFVESKTDFIDDSGSEDVHAIFFDATGNGMKDLYVASGGNEKSLESADMLHRLYINQGEGLFQKSPESIPQFTVNGLAVTAADFNGDGFLDLFVGGHSASWRYGVGPRSFILQNDGTGKFEDVTEEVAPDLETIGNVTSAAWIDVPGKELPDLVVAGEWMAVLYFENNSGILTNKTRQAGLDQLRGLWQTMETADITGNGYTDIILGNFGLNSRLQASADEPLNLYVGDFDENGQTAPLLTQDVNGTEMPFEQFDELFSQISDMNERVRSYSEFASQSAGQIFESAKLNEALKKSITELQSIVLINHGEEGFQVKPLPVQAQWFPVKAIESADIDRDGKLDLILAGNIYDVRPSLGGKQDAGIGLVLKGDGNGSFTPLSMNRSGYMARGETRALRTIIIDGKLVVVTGLNDEKPVFFQQNE